MSAKTTDRRIRVLIPVADGTEDIEAVAPADLLRRAGCDVCIASVDGEVVACGRGTRLVADARWETVDPAQYDAIVVPGGAHGVERLATHPGVLDALRAAAAADRWIAAICAGPLVLQAAGVIRGRPVTCHPATAARLADAVRQNEPVVVNGRFVTSQGAGTAVAFALTLIQCLCGSETARRVAVDIVAPPP